MNPAPICDNCKRVVHLTERVGILRSGAIVIERDLCSACRVHVVDCFEQAAPWIQRVPVKA
jgi:MinD superfamily P-loop ATPase